MTAQLINTVERICPICRESHRAANEVAFSRKVDECRNKFIGFLNNREYLNALNRKPEPVDTEADTVVKPIQVAS